MHHDIYILSEHGNLIDVIRSADDLGCLLHANDIIQYRDGINVPHKKNTVKFFVVIYSKVGHPVTILWRVKINKTLCARCR